MLGTCALLGLLAWGFLEGGPPWPPDPVQRVGWLRWALGLVGAFVALALLEGTVEAIGELFRRSSPLLTPDQRRRQRLGSVLVATVTLTLGLLVFLGAYWLVR